MSDTAVKDAYEFLMARARQLQAHGEACCAMRCVATQAKGRAYLECAEQMERDAEYVLAILREDT